MQIDRTSPIPLYFQLVELLRDGIESGLYPPGGKLPTEAELCTAHDVSRSVVRQALQSLAQERLIETERGRGAFVLDRRVPVALVQLLDPLAESMARAGFRLTTRILRQDRIRAPAAVAAEIGEAEAVFLERLRYADGVVFLLVRNYLPYSRFSGLLQAGDLSGVSLYDHLARHHDAVATTGRRQVELARLADPDIAAHLRLDLHTHALFNREVTRDQHGRVMEYYESWHHPDRTRLVIDLQRRY